MATGTSVPLEHYGMVGDMRTIAMVGRSGSIDWMCWPRVDSPSLFASLLDPEAGHWTIRPDDDDGEERQVYLSGTNVLITRFHGVSGIVEIEDYLTVDADPGGRPRHLVRLVRCRRGRAVVRSEMAPRPDYGRARADARSLDGSAVRLVGPDAHPLDLVLSSSHDLRCGDGSVTAVVELAEGETAWFALGDGRLEEAGCRASYRDTIDYWRAWTELGTYAGRWREQVERSALTLKLLTHAPTGAIVAAPTTSLPEVIGGGRNWDYRYVWIRDAAFTLYAFIEIGHLDEAQAFTRWLVERIRSCDASEEGRSPLSPVYDLDGREELDEKELDHLAGYAGSRPVRVGNAASGQLQLDIYGEMIDALYLADKHGDGLALDTWDQVCVLVDWVTEHWHCRDHGIWEPRVEPQRTTSSLLMCWVAVERAIRMARRRGRPAPVEAWRRARDEMHHTLVERGWSDDRSSFVQTLDGSALDASLLLMPLVKFAPPTDDRWLRTLDAIGEGLAHGPLVDRYDVSDAGDGLAGEEGSFTMCSFWYVEALARSGRVDEARGLFDRLLSYAGPTGLFSEEIGADGRLLGNFPQALTHLALISAAVHLDEVLP